MLHYDSPTPSSFPSVLSSFFYLCKVNLSLYSTVAVFILDAEGNRIISKYYQPRVAQIYKDTHHRTPSAGTIGLNGHIQQGQTRLIQQGQTTGPIPNTQSSTITVGGLTPADLMNPYRTTKEQKVFEKAVWEKTKRAMGEILVFEGQLILWKQSLDATFYLIGRLDENELMLSSGLQAFYDAVNLLLKHQVEKRSLLENLDLVSLALNETIDDG